MLFNVWVLCSAAYLQNLCFQHKSIFTELTYSKCWWFYYEMYCMSIADQMGVENGILINISPFYNRNSKYHNYARLYFEYVSSVSSKTLQWTRNLSYKNCLQHPWRWQFVQCWIKPFPLLSYKCINVLYERRKSCSVQTNPNMATFSKCYFIVGVNNSAAAIIQCRKCATLISTVTSIQHRKRLVIHK